MQLSDRIKGVAPSATMAMTQAARAMREAGQDVISLSVGEPDFATPQHILDAAAKAMADGHTTYTAADGITELKEAKMNIFRWSNQQRRPTEDTTIYLAIIHKWSIDQAHIWIEPSEILNTDPVIFNNGIDSISFDGSSNMNHYEVAEFIYQAIEKNLPTTANGMKIFDSDSDNQNVFRLVMGDYYRLTGIL